MARRRADEHTKELPRLDWCSPIDLIQKARELTGWIDYDPCGNPNSVVGARVTNMLPDGTKLEVGSGKNKQIITVNYETEMLSGFELPATEGAVAEAIADGLPCFRTVEYGDGLLKPFPGVTGVDDLALPHVWNNNPYGRQYNKAWAEKNHREGTERVRTHEGYRSSGNPRYEYYSVRHLTCLTSWAPEVQWCDYYWDSDAICNIRGRLRYGGAPNVADFDSALVYWGPSPERWAALFTDVGRVTLPRLGRFLPYTGPTIIGGAT